MSDMDPAAAARVATGEAADVAGEVSALPDAADAQRTDSGGSAGTLIDGLLETQPAGSIAEFPDMPDAGAHALIGAQKFINGIAGDRQLDGGKPAVVDFIQAGVSLMSGSDAGSDDGAPLDDTEGTAAADVPAPAAAGDVGGELHE